MARTAKSVRGRRFRLFCGSYRIAKEVMPMDVSHDAILEALQSVYYALLIIQAILELRQRYKRWRMERKNGKGASGN